MPPLTPLAQQIRHHHLRRAGQSVAYGLGCAWIGHKTEPEARATLDAAYDAGYRLFDTSAAYGDSERWLGAFLPQVDRASLFLVSKARVVGDTPADAADSVRTSLQRSLERLRTDHLDLFHLHDVDSLDHTFAEGGPLEVLLDAKRQGLIRHFGLATRPHVLLEQATIRGGFDAILTYNDYTPIDPSARLLIGVAKLRGLAVINASPLASGLLTGRDPRTVRAGQVDPRRGAMAGRFLEHCRAHGVDPVAAAMQFPLHESRIDITLTGPATPDEVHAGVAALRAQLPRDFWPQWRAIRRAALQHPTADPNAPAGCTT